VKVTTKTWDETQREKALEELLILPPTIFRKSRIKSEMNTGPIAVTWKVPQIRMPRILTTRRSHFLGEERRKICSRRKS